MKGKSHIANSMIKNFLHKHSDTFKNKNLSKVVYYSSNKKNIDNLLKEC